MLSQDVNLCVKCCLMYYNEGISQLEIGKQLGISHSTVCRLINQAREQGIVRIEIAVPADTTSFPQLERRMEKRFHLREVIIAPDGADETIQKNNVARAACAYLQRAIPKGSLVGVAMGTTLCAMYQCMEMPVVCGHTYVPLIGGVLYHMLDMQSNEIASSFARVFGGKSIYLHAPAFVNNPVAIDSLREENSVREVIEYYNRLDACLISIGSVERGCAVLQTGYYSDETINDLYANGMVGDMALQFFDINGSSAAFDVNKKVFGMSLAEIKNVKHVVGLASGLHKTDAVIGAIRGGLVNVLVLHRSLAENVLAKCGEEEHDI